MVSHVLKGTADRVMAGELRDAKTALAFYGFHCLHGSKGCFIKITNDMGSCIP
jgi:hypothetical protein